MKLTNGKWFSVVCTLMDNDIRQMLLLVRPEQILTTVMTNIVVDKSRDNAEPFSICFLPQYSTTKRVFISERDQERASVLYNFLAIRLVSFPK